MVSVIQVVVIVVMFISAMSMCSSTSGMSSVSQMSVRDQIVARVGMAQRFKQQLEDDRVSLASSTSTVSRVRSAIL